LVKTAKENGFEGLQLNTWFKNNTAQRKIIDSELRNTTDENKRKELIDRKKELLTGSQVEYMKKVPKTGQRKYVTEMQRRSAMPGNE
jgi:ribosomal protein L29